ncbi:hypothetical protein CH293_21485 [Rhodococcus sp. 14-2470-1b]|nr:hypothetical protein CH293_21485 [Rhodococcus sp. 14-2470-1b]
MVSFETVMGSPCQSYQTRERLNRTLLPLIPHEPRASKTDSSVEPRTSDVCDAAGVQDFVVIP